MDFVKEVLKIVDEDVARYGLEHVLTLSDFYAADLGVSPYLFVQMLHLVMSKQELARRLVEEYPNPDTDYLAPHQN